MKGPTMKKLLLASAVSALFAAPATVLAQAKPAPVPTLDKVLEASGNSVSGYIDAMYTHSDRNQAAFSTRVRVHRQDKPAPAPPRRLEILAEGRSRGGYIDAMYTHSDRNQAAFSTRVFDLE